MLPTKLTRAAHRATTSTSSNICQACLATRRTHQRRHSSSKTPSSTDRYTNKPAGPTAKATKASSPASTEGEQPLSAAQPEARTQQRAVKSKPQGFRRVASRQDGKKVVPAEPVDQFAGLPSVPSIQSLSESDRSLSNFFSLHRPMSISQTFPAPTTQETFNTIFSTHPERDPWADGNSAERRPEDVIFTLHNTIEALENNANNSQDEGVRWEIIHESPSNQNSNVHHLDGQPRLKSLEELVAQFKPFRAPPPPQPFPEYDVKPRTVKEKKAASSRKTATTKPKQKTFTTTITLTESTYEDGQKTYSASSSPIVALPEPAAADPTRGLTRRERVRKLRQQAAQQQQQGQSSFIPVRKAPGAGGLRGERAKRVYLISVKRQRKLKMKKHKYKKLMKRTRNLRRRLERN